VGDDSPRPEVLVLHDGELGDVCALLGELGVEFVELQADPGPEHLRAQWDVVVGTPRRLLPFRDADRAVRIGVLERGSKTLVAMLQRTGVELVVRRPVHAAALRLLLLHALYRGPEKRRARRVSVGAPLRFRAGLLRRPGLLADVSESGCRLLTTYRAGRGQRLRVLVPGELTREGRSFALPGRVLRCGAAPGDAGGAESRLRTVALVFDDLPRKTAGRLRQLVSRFEKGPAVLEHGDAPAASRTRERRQAPRCAYECRVIALGEGATRVLLGRDISLGGMRVEPNPSLEVGDDLQIALHVRARAEPLVVRAVVDRDDGERGLVLRFRDLPETASDYLRKMVSYLPILAMRGDGASDGVIVTEILEHRERETDRQRGDASP
jgi:hypothetical protein